MHSGGAWVFVFFAQPEDFILLMNGMNWGGDDGCVVENLHAIIWLGSVLVYLGCICMGVSQWELGMASGLRWMTWISVRQGLW